MGTPSEPNGNLGLGQLKRVSEDIGALHGTGRKKRLIVVMRSTVFPGTCEDVVMPAWGDPRSARWFRTLSSCAKAPRFGTSWNRRCWWSAATIPRPCIVWRICTSALDVKACMVTLRTAEMIKYACNCFHAVKIGFANEIGALCGKLIFRRMR